MSLMTHVKKWCYTMLLSSTGAFLIVVRLSLQEDVVDVQVLVLRVEAGALPSATCTQPPSAEIFGKGAASLRVLRHSVDQWTQRKTGESRNHVGFCVEFCS